MTYATEIAKFNRKLVSFVKITLDRCNNVFSDAVIGTQSGLCEASGTPICYYSFDTCRDRNNYVKTTLEYKFQSNDSLLLPIVGSRPYLKSVGPLSNKIDPKKNVTVHASMEFVFYPDWGDVQPLTPIDHDKVFEGNEQFNTETTGEYWRLLFGRNPNYAYRSIILSEGVEGDSEGDLKIKFSGIIKDVFYQKDGTIKVVATDRLRQTKDITVPNAISKENKIVGGDITATQLTIPVVDGSEFKTFAPDLYIMDFADLFRVDITDGSIADINSGAGGAGTQRGLAYREDNNSFYSAGGTNIFIICKDTGVKTTLGAHGISFSAGDLAWDSYNRIMYLTNGTSLFIVNLDTGAATVVGSHSSFTKMRGLAVDRANSILYGLDNDTADTLVTINIATGAATSIGALGLGTIDVQGLAHRDFDDTLYAIKTVTGASNDVVISINKTTGVGTLGQTFADDSFTAGMDFINHETFVKIEDKDAGDEYIRLLSISGNTLNVSRNQYNSTTANLHDDGTKIIQVLPILDKTDKAWDNGTPVKTAMLELLLQWMGFDRDTEVDEAKFISESVDWFSSERLRGIIEKPMPCETVLNWIRQPVSGNIFVNEDQKITLTTPHPVNEHTDTLITLTEDNSFIDVAVDRSQDDQTTRVIIYFDITNKIIKKSSPKEDEFDSIRMHLKSDLETDDNYGYEKAEVVFNPLLFRDVDAKALGVRHLRRYGVAPLFVKFKADRKDYISQTGDVIDLTSKEFMDNAGVTQTLGFEIVGKKEKLDGDIEFSGLQTKYIRKEIWINHSGAADWLSATATEKIHCYIGTGSEDDAEGHPKVSKMSDGSQGYYIF